MTWLRKIADNDLLDSLFDKPLPNEIRRDPPATRPMTLTLYRGFDADLDELEKVDGGYELSPKRSEQGVLWFTHQMINGYDPIEYVTGRGKYILTYPLECTRQYQRVYYDDGEYRDDIPEEIREQTNTMENCRFYGGVELPDGWFFSYKTEKFIVCTIPIVVTPDMIKEDR